MSRPVNIAMPCDGDAYQEFATDDAPFKSCESCWKAAPETDPFYTEGDTDPALYGKCTGPDGWPLMAHTAAEVARERGEGK